MYRGNNIGVIGCGASGKNSLQSIMGRMAGSQLKKVLYEEQMEQPVRIDRYPQAEIVQNKESIIHDENIDLVIVASTTQGDLNLVSEALKAGKPVRIL